MAYFSNGHEGDYYEEKYCRRCVHGWHDSPPGAPMCPVWRLHMIWNYDAVGQNADETKATALNTLWPTEGVHNGPCSMFHAREGEGEA